MQYRQSIVHRYVQQSLLLLKCQKKNEVGTNLSNETEVGEEEELKKTDCQVLCFRWIGQ